MNRDLQKHKQSDCIKWIAVFLAVILLATGVAAALTQGFKEANPYCWFGHDYDESGKCVRCGKEKPIDEDDVSAHGENLVFASVENHGINVVAEPVNDIAPTAAAANSQTLTATVSPAEASNKTVDWSIAWKNASSSWATGKTVTDYVTVTPTSDGALTATVQCLQAFAEQVVVKVTLRADTSISATCNVDYRKKLESVSYTLTDKTSSHGDPSTYGLKLSTTMGRLQTVSWNWYPLANSGSIDNDWSNFGGSFSASYSIGTIDDPVTSYKIIVELSSDLKTKLDAYASQYHTGYYKGTSETYDSSNILSQGNLFKTGMFSVYTSASGSHYSMNATMWNRLREAMISCSTDFKIQLSGTTQSGTTVSQVMYINISDTSLQVAATSVSLSGNVVF